MGCANNAYCDFCDARCGAFIFEKKHWIDLCKEYNKWCSWDEVKDMSFPEALEYIENLPVLVPMEDN